MNPSCVVKPLPTCKVRTTKVWCLRMQRRRSSESARVSTTFLAFNEQFPETNMKHFSPTWNRRSTQVMTCSFRAPTDAFHLGVFHLRLTLFCMYPLPHSHALSLSPLHSMIITQRTGSRFQSRVRARTFSTTTDDHPWSGSDQRAIQLALLSLARIAPPL